MPQPEHHLVEMQDNQNEMQADQNQEQLPCVGFPRQNTELDVDNDDNPLRISTVPEENGSKNACVDVYGCVVGSFFLSLLVFIFKLLLF